jgi:hypothetical protein
MYEVPKFKSVLRGPFQRQWLSVLTDSVEPKTSNGAARRRRRTVMNFVLAAVSAVVSG